MTKKRPGDVTGRRAAILAEEAAEERKLRASELSMMTEAANEERTEVVDLSDTARAVSEGGLVEVEQPLRTFRVNSTIEEMTFGAGNSYTFEEGRTYKAPKPLYDHLEELGYVWH